jgi:hypothetical protein
MKKMGAKSHLALARLALAASSAVDKKTRLTLGLDGAAPLNFRASVLSRRAFGQNRLTEVPPTQGMASAGGLQRLVPNGEPHPEYFPSLGTMPCKWSA